MRSKSPELMAKIKQCVEEHYEAYMRSPSINVIANQLKVNKSTVHRYLVEMDSMGILSYQRGKIRTDATDAMPEYLERYMVSGSVPCGPPEEKEESIEGYISVPGGMFGPGEFFFLRASGDSMVDAKIDDGDLVLIRKQLTAEEGQIVVALSDGGSTLKRLHYDDDGKRFVLCPENREKNYPVIKGNECSIQGVAIKVLKDLH